MSFTELRHGCKINYSLKVGKRLPSGYHEIESIFLPVGCPYDRIVISRSTGKKDITVRFVGEDGIEGRFSAIDPEDNSLVHAYRKYAELTSFRPSLDITVFKMIPAGGGLGGGSANAAALLLHLQKETENSGGRPLSGQALSQAAASIGADVPFFLSNKPSYVSGTGEVIRPVENPVRERHLLLVCPDLSIATGWAYAELDRRRQIKNVFGDNGQKLCKNSPEQGLTYEMHQANYSSPDGLLEYGNDFEEVVFSKYSSLARIKKQLLDSGAATARLSGTGATIFGFFREAADAKAVEVDLAEQGLLVYSQRI